MAVMAKQFTMQKHIAIFLQGVPRSFCAMALSHPVFIWDAQSIFAETAWGGGMAIAPGPTANAKKAAAKMAMSFCARRAFFHMSL